MSAAGYSGTPLSTKLGIKPGRRVALLGAPDETWGGLRLVIRLEHR